MSLASQYQLAEIPSLDELGYTDRFNPDWMSAQRQVGDPLADAVIRDLRDRFPIKDPSDMLEEIIRLASSEGGIYREFLEACYYVPPWVDFEAMEPARRMIATSMPWQGISMLTGAVAGSAFYINAEKVMSSTGRIFMLEDIDNRMTETGAIMGLQAFAGQLQPGGRGHKVVMRVRVLHAAIRHWILSRQGEPGSDDEAFDSGTFGIPINQMDTAFASTLFDYVNIRGMLRLGLELGDEQIQAQHMMWRYICYVIGLDPAWSNDNIGEQKKMWMAIVKHQAQPDNASVAALNLLDGLASVVPAPMQKGTTGLLQQLTANLSSPEYLSNLKLQRNEKHPGLRFIRGAARLNNLAMKVPGVEPFVYRMGMSALKSRFMTKQHTYSMETPIDQETIQAALEEKRRQLDAA